MAVKLLWNDGWEFCELEFKEQNLEIPGEASWEKIDIPHDWMIYDTHHLYRSSIGWYRKELYMDEWNPEEEVIFRFDGVYMDTSVFINGSLAGEWKYGYSTFEIEAAPFLQKGENIIYVRVVYRESNTRWYSGAGIYRNVWLKRRNKNHILSDGIYITPVKLQDNCWMVEIDTEIVLDGAVPKSSFALRQCLMDMQGNLIAEGEKRLEESEESPVTVSQSIGPVESPALWDIGRGNLYRVVTQFLLEGQILETEEQKIGFRTMEFLPDKGFILNGRRVKVNGACEHHDLGALGASFYREAARRKLIRLREMGVVAIRTAHNMPAPELMDLTDEMGFLVMSEAFDMWEKPKTPYDYARFFQDWYERDVASWVRRDRNHASLMMWSIGNEIQDTLVEGRGMEITVSLKNAVRQHDYKNHAPVTLGSNFMKWNQPKECAEVLDTVGYNYAEYLYEEHHREHKGWVIYGSETSSILASRGIYHFPLKNAILTDEDEQCSALGNSITGWGALSYEACICDDRDADYSLGQFIWTGFDYIGESTPYETKNSYFGQVDTAGFPKDSFYIFQSEWTDYRKNPMVHVFPYWDFNEGQNIDVQVCSNAPKVELFFNEQSLGIHEIDHAHGRNQIGKWQLPYQKGSITAVAYDLSGREVARETRHSFSDVSKITAAPDKCEMYSDGRDLIFVEISAYDVQGNPVENGNNRICVEVEGAGRLIGLDNGDSTDFDAYKGKSKRLFGGKLLAIIGSKTKPGEITVTISSPGLEDCCLTLHGLPIPEAGKTSMLTGVSAIEENREYPIYGGGSKGGVLTEGCSEIPIRKIELCLKGNAVLTKENSETEVLAIRHPADVTYRTLEWKAVNDTGIEVNFVELTPTEDGVKVKASGDGMFRLKCFSRNGGSSISVQSVIEMKAEGIGRVYLEPYVEIPAGLCDFRAEQAREGIEHGINFLGCDKGQGESKGAIGFTGIDFGSYGSDEITLSVFANTNDPVTFRIWEGKPGQQGSELLADCFYHKPPKWMVFQEQSYKLKKRIKGKTALYLATEDGFQLKGICFKKQERAYARLQAAECDCIYGDAYEIGQERVEKIGNNVSLVFEDMDFGEKGTDTVILNCRSYQGLNPIQIRFAGETESSVQMIEAKESHEYGQQEFKLEKLKGKGTLSFIFLPGSCFDFNWFQFHN